MYGLIINECSAGLRLHSAPLIGILVNDRSRRNEKFPREHPEVKFPCELKMTSPARKPIKFHPRYTPGRRIAYLDRKGTPPHHHPSHAVDHATRPFPRSSTALRIIHSVTADCNRMTRSGSKATITPTDYLPVEEEHGRHRIRRYGPGSLRGKGPDASSSGPSHLIVDPNGGDPSASTLGLLVAKVTVSPLRSIPQRSNPRRRLLDKSVRILTLSPSRSSN